ncbi:pyridoxamine 5'-phosphate oxidase family protein [Streptomyces beijiangensis]|uniref:Pyridoxamine 5'-phosphate oxidase family protein n=1 Tax=Streptomyces beijiangensis TaxID=163361 RepID=A0A939FAX6_9ACTN|nr:pyridoxamine 5'-phosphate oxidase family protein [Streptomyces beijiangensis]MBO0515257.1 pyridoxamine 5'-phosphate oxidase family protein [Streptomyces beijiangensis]
MATYHQGSLTVQGRVGVRAQAEHVGRSIGDGIKPVAAAFLGIQPMLVIGAADGEDRIWASLLTGRPGFVRATGPRSISVTGGPTEDDPLYGALEGPVGTIALDPRTRRRMRLNGTARTTPRGLAVEADEVFANCPKYIQRRDLLAPDATHPTGAVRRGGHLTPDQERFLRAADTFFIATTATTATASSGGMDASHRGGNPGFITVESPSALSWRDYPGNAMFLTLGNLETDPRAGILVLDWATGDTLQLTGTARTAFDGTTGERRTRFEIDRTVRADSASPLRWSPPDCSPANPRLP